MATQAAEVMEPALAAPEAVNDAPALNEVEQLAAEMGWEPQTNYNGDPAKWRSASDWIKSTNANNRNLKREVKELKASVDRIASVADKQVRREVEAQAKAIEERFKTAVEKQDTAGAAEAVKDLRKLESEQAPPSADVEGDFARDNPWYGKDDDATAYAVAVSRREAAKGASVAKQLEIVVASVRKRFPELFEDAALTPKPQPSVNQPTSRTLATKRGKTFSDMPDAARNAADRMYEKAKLRGTAPDRKAWDAQYARDFFAEAGE